MTQAWYHVQTPYHLLQAIALAATSTAEERVLVATPMHPSQAKLVEILRDLPEQPFTEILVVPADRWGWADHRWRRRAAAAVNARQLRAELKRRPGRVDLFTCNIQTVEGFALVHAVKGRAKPGSVSVVEDGLGTYEKSREATSGRSRSGVRSLVRRTYLGPGAQRTLGQMPFDLIDSLSIGWPEAINNADWPGVRITSLPPPRDSWNLQRALAREAVPVSEVEKVRQLDVLIALPLSPDISQTATHADDLVTLVGDLTKRGLRVGLKHHPRADQALMVGAGSQAATISAEIPLELLLLDGTDRLTWVVADRTTAIVSTRRYRPDLRVALWPGLIPAGVAGAGYRHLLRVVGAVELGTFSSIAQAIEKLTPRN